MKSFGDMQGWRNEANLTDDRREEFKRLALAYVENNLKTYNRLRV